MRGAELKNRINALMRLHRIAPIERTPLPLLPPVSSPQIIEAVAASSDVDSERTSFVPGSLVWGDLNQIPLLVRHSDKVAGKLLSVDYRPDGRLLIKARVDDLEAARFGGLSIAASGLEAEVRAEESLFFHFIVRRATLDHIGMTDLPSNPHAIVTSRRDVAPWDDTTAYDDLMAALGRMRKALDGLKTTWPSAPAMQAKQLSIGAGPGYIYGRLPFAAMKSRPDSFSTLVAKLPRGDRDENRSLHPSLMMSCRARRNCASGSEYACLAPARWSLPSAGTSTTPSPMPPSASRPPRSPLEWPAKALTTLPFAASPRAFRLPLSGPRVSPSSTTLSLPILPMARLTFPSPSSSSLRFI